MSNMRSHCNRCGSQTNHAILHVEKRTGDDGPISWAADYFLLSCLGCDHVSFREENSNDHDIDENGDVYTYVEIYPKDKEVRARPSWFNEILEFDTKIRLERMLAQIYEAYDNKAYWLSIMGVRAVIESVMIEKVGDKGSFGENLGEFSKKGFITDSHRLALSAAIDQGSAAIHKANLTRQTTALSAIQVVENVLEAIFVVPLHEAKLKK